MYLDRTLIRKGTVYTERTQGEELVGFMDLTFLLSKVCAPGQSGVVYKWDIQRMPIAVVSDEALPRGVSAPDLREAFLAAPRKLAYARELMNFYTAEGVLMRMREQEADILVFDPRRAKLRVPISCDGSEHTRIGY